jgi:uncharacterized protein YeaO (DUF488 family)
MIRTKRAYEPSQKSDGFRVLVDRLWPRGLAKADAEFDAWLKDLAPSPELRRWFGHDPERYREFKSRYNEELKEPEAKAALAELAETARRRNVTLVYAAHDEEHNNAVVLAELLKRRVETAR